MLSMWERISKCRITGRPVECLNAHPKLCSWRAESVRMGTKWLYPVRSGSRSFESVFVVSADEFHEISASR